MGSSILIQRMFGAASRACRSKLSTRQSGRLMCTSSAQSGNLPWLMVPPSAEAEGGNYSLYSLAEKRVIKSGGVSTESSELVGSSHGWLAFFNERADRELFLWEPLSGRQIKLPQVGTLRRTASSVKKLIISHSPDDEECIAMMIYGVVLAFCRPGRSTKWTRIGDFYHLINRNKEIRRYVEMVYSASLNLFFCVTDIAFQIEAWDFTKSPTPKLVWRGNTKEMYSDDDKARREYSLDDNIILQRYLVCGQHINQLYYLKRKLVWKPTLHQSLYAKTTDFSVHKLEWEWENKGRLSYMDGTLDGLSMFVGTNHSIALAAPEFNPNSIYFTNAALSIPPPDIGVFDYQHKTFHPCSPQSMEMEEKTPKTVWFTPSFLPSSS